ncbi:hypothetical protein NB063_03345 [Rhodopirellula sp. ICT_H3.1]|uniref:Uncharacterized protein n=2 Tax=Aporhodopirellula aestuarii TaxID=2950107 RepID=A0ABT0TZJ1_9BACT|nr:hypothetical protein [Aporhodopirellula aestuarii]
MTRFYESLESIALTMTIETEIDAMLPGNRLLRWDWFSSLERIGGEPLPEIYQMSVEAYWARSEGEERSEAPKADTDRNKQHTDPATRQAVRDASDRGLSPHDIERQLGVPRTTVKRILGRRSDKSKKKQSAYVKAIDSNRNMALPRLMRFDEYGDRILPISPDEMKEVVELLLAGIHYRQVAADYGVCARDVKAMGVRPDLSDYDMETDIDDDTDSAQPPATGANQ